MQCLQLHHNEIASYSFTGSLMWIVAAESELRRTVWPLRMSDAAPGNVLEELHHSRRWRRVYE